MFRIVFFALMMFQAASAMANSSGSGFFINSVWVMTNDHVIETCTQVEVAGHGRALDILRDPESDLAVIRLERPFRGDTVPFRTRAPRLAENLHVLGYPLSGVLSDSVRVTSGSVSALDAFASGDGLIQISAPIQPGNSGGPVIDDAGEVIGVAVARLNRRDAQNVNFAISGSVAQDFLRARAIAFDGAPVPSSPADDLSDVIERVAAATVHVRCVGSGQPAPPPAAAATASDLVLFRNRDVIGYDYLFLRDVSFAGCQTACEGDRRCRAFTFNTRHNACFLKENGTLLVSHADAISAVAGDLAHRVADTGFTVATDMDSPGGDFMRIRQSDFLSCLADCALDPLCRAFAYVRNTRDCWLKDRVGHVQPMPGVEFGVR